MTVVTPVWVWLPDRNEPARAGEIVKAGSTRFIYQSDYIKTDGALALDPVELRISRSSKGTAILGSDGLPGVVRDAKPAGYGEDRLKAIHGDNLDALQLLELGVPDGVGAIEACSDIERKMQWRPKSLGDLQQLTEKLEGHEPSSRALRRLNDDLDTSAGGERPKATLVHEDRLWLVKMQARGDRQAMPAREFVTMRLAEEAELFVAPVKLHTFGAHQVLMVQRFDREGDPFKPTRKLYASAHTVLRLSLSSVKGDPERTYLGLADRLRIWTNDGVSDHRERLGLQLVELWKRIAFNALVGNADDHALNTGLLFDRVVAGADRRAWGLSPAFDITPNMTGQAQKIEEGPNLSLATGTDGRSGTSVARLGEAAERMGLNRDDAIKWLIGTAKRIAEQWEPMLRSAAAPIVEDTARMDRLVDDVRPSFAYSEWLAKSGG
ncbi:MAG TPA: HipA domain-containing protein [Burkholderiaceae bacterium]|jgi:serine/threonine-protein kinase HipA